MTEPPPHPRHQRTTPEQHAQRKAHHFHRFLHRHVHRRLWRFSAIALKTLQLLGDAVLGIGVLWSLGLCIYQPIALLPLGLILLLMAVLRQRGWHGHLRLWVFLSVAVSITTFTLLPNPQPSEWETPWAKTPEFHLDGNLLTITNLRDFRYRTPDDYDVHYRTETYDLSTITGADFAECYWDGHVAICHTMLSFTFADGRHLVVSGETRLPKGVEQNAVGGLYKQYGIAYLFGTEEDIFALRTNYRHEDLHLYPMNITPQQARGLLLRMVSIAEEAHREHTPYNTLTNNCSSGIVNSFVPPGRSLPWKYRYLPVHNGSIAGILFRHGALQSGSAATMDELRRRNYLGYDIAPGEPEHYSQAIRDKIRQQNAEQQPPAEVSAAATSPGS